MKYVVFLDILGFKERLKSLDQFSAKQFIADFSSTVYDLWNGNQAFEQNLDGYIVSDSLIISTKNTASSSLEVLLEAVESICRNEFSRNTVLLRGAIAKGEFDKLEAKELKSLGKGLIVGQAYVDAYILEGSVKTLGIVLSNDVYEDIKNLSSLKKQSIIEENIRNEISYVLRYLSIDFLMDITNLDKFIKLASSAKWLPHYYNALYFSMKNEDSKKASKIFENIIMNINDSEPSEHWRDLDIFIHNAFHDDVISDFQKRFLGFIRSKIC